ncbi:uncharacterized protein LOC122371941 [Amphibalanus amphitrite]|uniref:uncharacterized protein LOC122371941 n=1 Tax=Amphibalanus amphitrite TaxID=1232801 RepID=UPI001C9065EC|nr:uncharacterized protein LOC122371941 [Amphibalanus amphitrite]
MQCTGLLPEVALKVAVPPPSPATLLHRTIQRRLTLGQVTAGRRARRRLFSAVDADDVSRFVKRELAAIRAADRRRYNFDFDRMEPLEGRFQWERVGVCQSPCENTPMHRSARRLQFDCPLGEPTDGLDSARSALTCPGKHRIGLQPVDDAPTKSLPEASQLNCCQSEASSIRSRAAREGVTSTRLKQAVLTDLWQTRKRAGVWVNAEEPPKKRVSSSLQPPAPGALNVALSEERNPAPSRQSVLSELQDEQLLS